MYPAGILLIPLLLELELERSIPDSSSILTPLAALTVRMNSSCCSLQLDRTFFMLPLEGLEESDDDFDVLLTVVRFEISDEVEDDGLRFW